MVVEEMQVVIQRAQNGDGGAFGELYEHFSPQINRYLLRNLNGHREAAEDLTAEVFVKVLERLHRYQFRGLPFSAWLYRIARNHTIDHLRSLPKQFVGSIEDGPEIPERHSQHAMNQSLDRQEITGALQHLTPEQRRVVVLRFLNGLTTAETAMTMSKTEDAVKKLQARGLVQLRRILERAQQVGVRSTRRPLAPVPPVAVLGAA